MRRLLEKPCLVFSVQSVDRDSLGRLGVDLQGDGLVAVAVAVAAGEGEGRIGSSIHHSIHHLVK